MPTPPRRFFDDFVRRTFEEFRAAPKDELRAKQAVSSANDMAERMLHHYAGSEIVYGFGVDDATRYREALTARCEEFGIVRDVADGHKHVRLTRKTRRVTSSEQTGARPIRWTNNAVEEVKFTNDAGEAVTFIGAIIVELDDHSTRPLLPMLETVVAMWDRLSGAG